MLDTSEALQKGCWRAGFLYLSWLQPQHTACQSVVSAETQAKVAGAHAQTASLPQVRGPTPNISTKAAAETSKYILITPMFYDPYNVLCFFVHYQCLQERSCKYRSNIKEI